MHVCSPIVEHFTPFSHITFIHYSITIYFFQLPVNFCRFLISGIQESNHTPHLKVGGIMNHAVHFEVTQNAQGWLVATSIHNIMRKHVMKASWPWKEKMESAAWRECAVIFWITLVVMQHGTNSKNYIELDLFQQDIANHCYMETASGSWIRSL